MIVSQQLQGKTVESFLVEWRCHERQRRSLETMPQAVLLKLCILGVQIPIVWQCWFYPVVMPMDLFHASFSVTVSFVISQTYGLPQLAVGLFLPSPFERTCFIFLSTTQDSSTKQHLSLSLSSQIIIWLAFLALSPGGKNSEISEKVTKVYCMLLNSTAVF